MTLALPGKPSGVNNTAYLFAVLAAAFIFWVTVRGDLPKWLGLFGLAGTAGAPAPAAQANQLVGPLAGVPSVPALPSLNTVLSPEFTGSLTGGVQSESATSATALASQDNEFNAVMAD